MCIYEYDEEKQRKWDREEGLEEGLEEGRREGRKMGHQEERENSIRVLISTYKKFHYAERDLLEVLEENYHLTEEEAERRITEMEEKDKLSCY